MNTTHASDRSNGRRGRRLAASIVAIAMAAAISGPVGAVPLRLDQPGGSAVSVDHPGPSHHVLGAKPGTDRRLPGPRLRIVQAGPLTPAAHPPALARGAPREGQSRKTAMRGSPCPPTGRPARPVSTVSGPGWPTSRSRRAARPRAWPGCARRGCWPSWARCRGLGDLRVGHPLADQPGDLELPGGQRPPRLVVRGMAARHPQHAPRARRGPATPGALPQSAPRSPSRRPPRTGSSGPGTGPGRAAPRPPPMPGRGVPAGDGRLEGDAGDPGRPRQGPRAPAVVERRTRDIGDRSSCATQAASQLAASTGRPASCAARTPVTTNGTRSTRSSTADRPGQGVAAEVEPASDRRPGGRPRQGPTAAAG